MRERKRGATPAVGCESGRPSAPALRLAAREYVATSLRRGGFWGVWRAEGGGWGEGMSEDDARDAYVNNVGRGGWDVWAAVCLAVIRAPQSGPRPSVRPSSLRGPVASVPAIQLSIQLSSCPAMHPVRSLAQAAAVQLRQRAGCLNVHRTAGWLAGGTGACVTILSRLHPSRSASPIDARSCVCF